MKINYWKLVTRILAGSILILLLTTVSGGRTKTIPSSDEGAILIELLSIETKVGQIGDDVRSYVRGGSSSNAEVKYQVTRMRPSPGLSQTEISVKGEVKGFSCTSNTTGTTGRPGGYIESEPECFVLTK